MLVHYLLTGVLGKNAGAGSDINGSLSQTIGAVTLSSTGTLAIQGSLSATIAPITLSSTASVAITGSETTTLGPVTLSATGSLAIQGSLAATLDAITLSASGTVSQPPVTETPVVEVTWPARLERDREMQRANLARYLAEERARIAAEADNDNRPSRRKVKQAVSRIIERAASDGLLTAKQIAEARPILIDLVAGEELSRIQGEMDMLLAMMAAAQDAYEDEAAIVLLLAA